MMSGEGDRWILFDLVGTLIQVEPSVAAVYARVALREGFVITPEQIRRRFPRAFSQWMGDAGSSTNRDDQRRRWQHIVQSCFLEVPAVDQPRLFECLWSEFQQPEVWRVAAAWPELATGLHRRGYHLAIASNFDQRIYRLIDSLPPLQRTIERVFCSADIGWSKPHPHFFQAIAGELRCEPASLCLVGDDYAADYCGSQQAGWRAILLDAHYKYPTVMSRIERLEDLGAFFG